MFSDFMINLAILLIVGLLFSKLAKLVKFPNVTGYLKKYALHVSSAAQGAIEVFED